MSRFAVRHRSAALLAVTLPVSAALTVAAIGVEGAHAAPGQPAKSTTKWTRISKNTAIGIASPGLFRTADGRLHVIWPSHEGTKFSLHYSTVGGSAHLLASGVIVKNWPGVSFYPRLVPGPKGGLRLIFTGGNGVGGSPFNTGAMYIADSNSAGKAWTLVNGSLSQSKFVPDTDTAATTEANGVPVAAWSGIGETALEYHAGIDPSIPATSPDQQIGIGAVGGVVAPTLIRTSTGKIVAGWFNGSGEARQGYWAAQIWPSKGARMKAPNSGTSQANGQPLQPVALVAHPGGGSYMAYCVPTKTLRCAHIALWRVGAARAVTVPGSSSKSATLVTLTAGHAGHLWISWFDTGTSKISVVRTNTAVTRFGLVRRISAPGPLFDFLGLSALGGSGPLDLVALAAVNGNSSPAYFDTELFPALRIHASKARVSNLHSTTITFTLDDSGDVVPGVTVKFLGKSAKTNSKGVVKFTVPKGTAKGKHTAVATKAGYASATFTVRVT